MNHDLIMENLAGDKPIDWDAAKKLYAIEGFAPEKLKILPRLPQLTGIVTRNESSEEVHKRAKDDVALANGTKAQKLLRLLARQYCALENKGARMPKFSKWVTSLFKDDKELHNALAKYSQNAGAGFIISCNPVDILRAADTKHYWSCLDHNGGFTDVLPAVLTKAPGIAIVYVNGPDGKMQGRAWIHCCEVDGKRAFAIARQYGNGLLIKDVAAHIEAMTKLKCYSTRSVDYGLKPVNGSYVGCFTKNLHWDDYTWDAHSKFYPFV